MRICVLGHRGMLGHVVARYLTEQGCEIFMPSERFIPDAPEPFLEQLATTSLDWCVNCIGVSTRQHASLKQIFEINALLPELLARHLPIEVGIIHPSTDAVFTLQNPNRDASDIPDAEDSYGQAKRYAENVMKSRNHHIIRCSIIGLELGIGHSLLNWYLSQTNAAPGYINHYWNGITTLEWAKLCYHIISGELQKEDLPFQPGICPAITKFELLILISQIWNHPVTVKPFETEIPITRTLIPTIVCPALDEQLRELKSWHEIRWGKIT